MRYLVEFGEYRRGHVVTADSHKQAAEAVARSEMSIRDFLFNISVSALEHKENYKADSKIDLRKV